jgi:hypothetical protein
MGLKALQALWNSWEVLRFKGERYSAKHTTLLSFTSDTTIFRELSLTLSDSGIKFIGMTTIKFAKPQ